MRGPLCEVEQLGDGSPSRQRAHVEFTQDGDFQAAHTIKSIKPPDDARSSSPSQCAINWLLSQGITNEAIREPWPIRSTRVVFDDRGGYMPIPGVGDFAFVIAIYDGELPIDSAAWQPKTGKIATRLGAGALLGEEQVGLDGTGTTGRALLVWRDPISWLKAERRGVVIADPILAAHRLSGIIIKGEDDRHDRELGNLQVPKPIIANHVSGNNSMAAT